jgi:hypothetical protein
VSEPQANRHVYILKLTAGERDVLLAGLVRSTTEAGGDHWATIPDAEYDALAVLRDMLAVR